MRTNVWFPKGLHEEIRIAAEKSGKSISAYLVGLHESRDEEFYKIQEAVRSLDQWAMIVKARDNFLCSECGSDENIEAHHIQPQCDYPELIFQLENGITLCRKCHKEKHGKGIISNKKRRVILVEDKEWGEIRVESLKRCISAGDYLVSLHQNNFTRMTSTEVLKNQEQGIKRMVEDLIPKKGKVKNLKIKLEPKYTEEYRKKNPMESCRVCGKALKFNCPH